MASTAAEVKASQTVANGYLSGHSVLGPLPELKTVGFVSLFLVVYLATLLHKTIRSRIDLYDMLLLSTVALLPSAFVLFPGIAYGLASFVGVAFPFVILFGGLFLVVFTYLYRLGKRLNEARLQNIRLIQELGILRQEFDALQMQVAPQKKAN